MSLATTVRLNGPVALRALARAFGHFDSFDRFVSGLQAALDRTPGFEQLLIRLERDLVEGSERFPPGALAFPLLGESGMFGTLQVTPGGEHRQFGAEDLHLMAGLADFLSAVLAQAEQARESRQTRELFRLLLNQAPVGIAAYSAAGRPLIANDLAERWLDGAPPPFAELAAGDGSFHLRTSGKLVYGIARRIGDGAEADWLVALHDLTGEQVKLLELMKRDTYRALAEQRPLGFALVEESPGSDGVLRRLPALRAALREGEAVGPYDAHRLGLVLGGAGGLQLRARLRELQPLLGAGLKLGYAELGRNGRSPEALLQAALQGHAPFAEQLRPALLIHDENPAVADTLALVLGRDYRVVQSADAARTCSLLAGESFEGLIAELDDSRTGADAESIVRQARVLQPGIRTFFTSVQPSQPGAAPVDGVMIEKPFDVARLRELIRRELAV